MITDKIYIFGLFLVIIFFGKQTLVEQADSNINMLPYPESPTLSADKLIHENTNPNIFINSNNPSIKDTTNKRWLRGNMHTHTFWSDGRDFPESVSKWYKDNNYDFLILTDHNILPETPVSGPIRGNHILIDGELWQRIRKDNPAVSNYLNSFGEEWVEKQLDEDEDYLQFRIKPLNEFRNMFEEPEKFLLIQGNEITDRHGIHILTFYVDEVIPPVGGAPEERGRMIKDIVRRVDEYRKRSGRNIFPILAHPNYGWNVTAEMIIDAQDLRFFEVWNGVPEANNDGNNYRKSMDQIWDIVLAFRLSNNGKPVYGLATDDAHDYHGGINDRNVGQGKGWVMVESYKLSAKSILDALDQGKFYSTTGIVLSDIQFDGETISVEIDPLEGVSYITEFIGTRVGFDTLSTPVLNADGNVIKNTTRNYSKQIGEVLSKQHGISSQYKFVGDELYVRVRITSTADQLDPITGKVIGIQRAWVQPKLPRN